MTVKRESHSFTSTSSTCISIAVTSLMVSKASIIGSLVTGTFPKKNNFFHPKNFFRFKGILTVPNVSSYWISSTQILAALTGTGAMLRGNGFGSDDSYVSLIISFLFACDDGKNPCHPFGILIHAWVDRYNPISPSGLWVEPRRGGLIVERGWFCRQPRRGDIESHKETLRGWRGEVRGWGTRREARQARCQERSERLRQQFFQSIHVIRHHFEGGVDGLG